MKTISNNELDLISGGIDYAAAIRATVTGINTAVNYASTGIGGYSLWQWWNSRTPREPELTRDDMQGF